MNLPVKSLLSVALLTAIVGSGVVFAQAQSQAPVDPQALVSNPVAPAAAPAPQAVVLPPSPGAPAPVAATTPVITPAPGTPVIVAPGPALPQDPDVARLRAESEAQAQRIAQMTAAGADESMLLREVARYQAKLSLLNAAAQVEKAQQTMATDRMKFQLDQAKSQAELQAARAPAIAVAAPGSVPGGSGLPGQLGAAAEEKLDVSLVGVSSFAGKRLAEISSSEFGNMSVEAGSTLPNGARVSSITDRSVVVIHRGKRQTIYLSMGGAAPAAAGKPPAPAVNKN